ncbi:DUF2877 domain-containing protein [Kribbella sp. NPDC059898]|uniref:DUF2877 domain-containing protein n=1 Tax=Kribbella sp. NPDC059898 TaxID=3346995 RepID=UPI0036499280
MSTCTARTLTALSADAPLLDALGGEALSGRALSGRALSGEVHSVFERVVNLVTPDGWLITLAARTMDDAPNTVRVDEASWTEVRAGELFTAADGRLEIAGLTVDLRHANRWQPQLPPLVAGSCEPAVVTIDEVLGAVGVAGGMVAVGATAFEREQARLLQAHSAGLVAALRLGDAAAVAVHVRGLVGLGPGLTPSGDDFLTGLLLSAASVRRLLAPAVAAQVHRTTAVSAVTLTEAARGRVRQSLVDLLRAVANGNQPDVRTAARRVLVIGRTSGTDILSGVRAGLHLELLLRGSA